ncbi:hypothetical protein M409DRAFT_60928 [Zasmidium cellare ATCC 36951]|uniref:Zn(2)-C6 fungal-type domain-containing protein n=1 Tax=Zasmidium cellare ATCC 36951 TaxID=1080233 RepID=A0A6A6C0W1_ZASCE|nr:uncharacterized protein M409DRAFT_60928 [Zasmidium cellare ATCC 36951]KAF2159346.1 hypothetical protein M409DRAFT_60928 [Zasmidium cellare ATCC 36951]
MTKLAHRVRAFAPKTKSGCKTCRSRRIKCDETKPSCKKCLTGDRTCEWFESASPTPPKSSPESSDQSERRVLLPARSAVYVPDPSSADVQPSSLGLGLDAWERSALGFFINRTARDLGYSFPTIEWISRTLQLSHEEPALRYAMVALGSMHQARRAYTHTSMSPVIEPGHLKNALGGYGKAMTHLRRRIEDSSVGNRIQTTSMILLSCLLFFCFEQLQGEQATACLHMQKGQRIIKEMLSSPHSTQIEPFLKATYGLFSGFEDLDFTLFQGQTLDPTDRRGVAEIAASMPAYFYNFEQAKICLKGLEQARGRFVSELMNLANDALKTLEAVPTDPAVVLCLQHCVSRVVELGDRRDLVKDLDDLQHGYDAWLSAFANAGTGLRGTPHSWAVIRMQCLISRFSARIMREPAEKVCDLYEDDFVEVLNLAEQCLLVYPSTDDFFASLSGMLSSSGYGLALSTDLLPHIALCGFKSRRTSTRERAIDILTVANKHDGVYQSAILARFVRRPAQCEQGRAMELGYYPGPNGFDASQIPEEARVADTVFAQVKYRPRSINMISCRYVRNEAGEPRFEITEDICDLFTGEDQSSTTYDIATPQSCQQGMPHSTATLVRISPESGSIDGARTENTCPSSSDNIEGVLVPLIPPKGQPSSSASPSSASSAPSAPANIHPVFSLGKDSKYSSWKSYPPRVSTANYSRSPGLIEDKRLMRIPAGTLPDECSRTESTLQPVVPRTQRAERELDNAKSPLLKLPAEIRNEIYELCVPHGEVFDTASALTTRIEGVEEGTASYVTPIQSRNAYEHHFGITQACRQLRKATIKMCYSGNIFMLRVVEPQNYSYKSNYPEAAAHPAETWLKTRSLEARQALSQVILQYRGVYDYYQGMDMVLFEPSLESYRLISVADVGIFEGWHASGEPHLANYQRCYEEQRIEHDFEDVLRKAKEGDMTARRHAVRRATSKRKHQPHREPPSTNTDLVTHWVATTATMARSPRFSQRQQKQREDSKHYSRLLILPPELRNRIFAFALPSSQSFITGFEDGRLDLGGDIATFKTICEASAYEQEFGLTQVCRQIRRETLKMAYAANTFWLDAHPRCGMPYAEAWIRSRPKEVLPFITKVVLESPRTYCDCACLSRSTKGSFDFDSGRVQTAKVGRGFCGGCWSAIADRVAEGHVRTMERVIKYSNATRRLFDLVEEFRWRTSQNFDTLQKIMGDS